MLKKKKKRKKNLKEKRQGSDGVKDIQLWSSKKGSFLY